MFENIQEMSYIFSLSLENIVETRLYNIDPLVQQLDKRHFCSFEISPIENFDDIQSGLLTLSITLRS